MSNRYSLAVKSVWAKVPKEERSRRMSHLAKLRHGKTPFKVRRRHALAMVRARAKKRAKGK